MASSLVENARTGPLRARITRPALVIRWILNGAGSGSPVGFLAAMCVQGKTRSGIRDTVYFQTGRRRGLVIPIPSAHQAQLRLGAVQGANWSTCCASPLADQARSRDYDPSDKRGQAGK